MLKIIIKGLLCAKGNASTLMGGHSKVGEIDNKYVRV